MVNNQKYCVLVNVKFYVIMKSISIDYILIQTCNVIIRKPIPYSVEFNSKEAPTESTSPPNLSA